MPLRHPPQPLTEAGRVLVCIAASLFAALLLIAWTAVPDDDALPPTPSNPSPPLTLTSAGGFVRPARSAWFSSVMRGL